MDSPTPRKPWINRAARGFALETRRALRRLLNLDSDRFAIEAAIIRMDRRLEDFSGPTGRVASLEKRVVVLSDALSSASASVAAIELALNALHDAHRTALAALEHRVAGLGESLSDRDATLLDRIHQLRDAIDAGAVDNKLGQAASLEELGAMQMQLTQTRKALTSALADARDSGAESAHRIQALEPAFQELFARAIFLETAACNAPIYAQPGLTAILHVGGWNERPLAVPSAHVGVLSDYYGSGPHAIERGVRAVIQRELKPDQVALDIGAHVGLHSVVIGEIVGNGGALHCFEPDPDLAAALMQTFIMNGLTRHGVIVNAALSDADGVHAFHRTLHSPESSLFTLDKAPERDVIEVKTLRLDSYFKPGARVDFAKIDAEGAEPSIIRGMARVLAENPELHMVMEFAPSHLTRAGEDPGAFHDALISLGFGIAAIDDDGAVTPIERARLLADETHNLWLTPRNAART